MISRKLPGLFVCFSWGLCAALSSADILTTCSEVGTDVVCSTSGIANTDGALGEFPGGGPDEGGFSPVTGTFTTGPFSVTDPNFVPGGLSAFEFSSAVDVASFGTGPRVFPALTSGRQIGVFAGFLLLPADYLSGTELPPSTSTFENQSFASLGMVAGNYTTSWGGDDNQSLELRIVPEPTGHWLAGFGALIFGHTLRRRRRCMRVGC